MKSRCIIPNESGTTDSKIALELTEKPLKPGDDLRGALGIDIIYFDLDKSNIRKTLLLNWQKLWK